MPVATRYFTVVAPQGLSTIQLDSKGCATCQITVKNVSGTAIDGRGILISLPVTKPPAGAVEKGWATIEGPTDRHFDVGEQVVFSIRIAVPNPKKGEARPAENCGLRLNVINIARPDESADQSPALSFTAPAYVPPPPSKLPLILAVAAAVLLIGGVATWLLLRNPTLVLAPGALGSPVVGRNPDGRLEVFVVGKNGDLWHRVQKAPSGSFGPWQKLTGGSGLISAPRVGYNLDGRMEIYGTLSGGVLWHVSQKAANGGWNRGASLGAPTGGIVGSVTVGANEDGRLEIFGVAPDHQLHHIIQTAPNGGWSAWDGMGAPTPGVFIGDPRVVSNADGRLELFLLANDQKVWHAWQTAPNNGWSSWGPFGDPGTPIANGAPFVGTNADGRIDVFATGTDGAIYHFYQTVPSDGWSSWSPLLAPAHGVRFLGPGAVAYNKDRRFQLFFIGSDGGLWTLAQSVPGGGWGQVRSLNAPPGQVLHGYQMPASGLNANGNLTAFITGTDGHIWHTSQTSPGGGWGSLVKD